MGRGSTVSALYIITCLACLLRNTANATIVTVELPSLPSSAVTTCHLPDRIQVTIHLPYHTVALNLLRSTDIHDKPPVFFLRESSDGTPRVSKDDSLVRNVKEVMYQDASHGSEIEVTCNVKESTIILDGLLKLEDGKFYRLEKSVDKSSSLYILTEFKLDSSFTGAVEIEDDVEDALNIVDVSGTTAAALELSTEVNIDVIALIEFTVYERFFSRSEGATPDLKRTDTLDNIYRHFAHIFNAVYLRYKTASPFINMNLAGYVVEDTASGDWFQSVLDNETNKAFIDASKLLETQYTLSISEGFPEHDHLVSFTTLDIYWLVDGEPSYSLAGLAKLSQICVENGQSVSIVEYQDHFIVDVFITAHEIGHCLSARHDGTNGNTCVASDNFIMTAVPAIYENSNPFTFSTCSAEYFDNHITGLLTGSSTYSRTCLLQRLEADTVPVLTNLPGQLFTFDEQCQVVYGNDSVVCRGFDTSSSSICLAMSCFNSTDNACYGRYADRGTTCGDKRWCEGGECVYSDRAPLADPTCLLGDQPVFTDGSNCTSLVTSADSCSNSRTETRCCDTCKEVICGIQCLRNGYINGTTCECVCPDCYRGTICDTAPKVCQNGGTLNLSNCVCACSGDWTGELCEQFGGSSQVLLAVILFVCLVVIIAIQVFIVLYCLLRKTKVQPSVTRTRPKIKLKKKIVRRAWR